MSVYNYQLYSTSSTSAKMSSKPSRAAPPPPVPSHAKNDRNNNMNRQNVAKIPTVIRPKMVETPKKKAPPRPPPPLMDASFVPTRTSSLNRSAVPPPVPPPPAHKPSKKLLNAKALKKVKLFGKSGKGSSNANGEFYTASMGNGRFGASYTNQALTQPPRGKKQAPMPPRGSQDFAFCQGAVATGTLISFDTPPSSPSCTAPPPTVNGGGSNIRSLLDEDFPEPTNGGGSLLDMDIPPMISASLSVDNFGSTPFDPFSPQPRKASLPVVTTTKTMFPPLSLKTPESAGRISQIREEFTVPPEGSPPPPRCPAPQLNPLESSVLTTTQPCGMALADYSSRQPGELSYSQYELIELIAEHDELHYLARSEDQEGIVRKDALEILTPLDDPQQDSEPESQQDAYSRQRPSSSTSTTDDKPETERYISQKPVASVQPFSSQQTNTAEAERATALYDFDAQRDDELSFKSGDRLLVTSHCDDYWLYGCNVKDLKFGYFPLSFVMIFPDSGSETESLKEDETTHPTEKKNADDKVDLNSSPDGCPAVALFAFAPEQEGDLGFDEGDVIFVMSRINKDWLMGRNSKGETGQFPATFVQPSEDTATVEASSEDAADGAYVCLYDFEAQQNDDLTIRVGDKIRVTEKISEEWWQGHVLGSTREGIFPSNFVEPL